MRDANDRLLLRVQRWQEREFVAIYGTACPYLINARFTEPTFEVCTANRDPKECNPLRKRYVDLSSIYG